MNCKGVQPLLSAYLDRELTGDEMLDIRTHLSRCDACRDELDSLRSLKRLLCGLEATEPPAYLEERLLATTFRERPTLAHPRRLLAGALIFASVAVCSMFVTMAVLSGSPQAAGAAHAEDRTIPFEIQRDQAFSGGGDALGGAPLITAAAYGGR